MTKQILTQEQLKKVLHYNHKTGIFTRLENGGIAGYDKWSTVSARIKKYRQISVNGRPYHAHILAWLYMTGEFPVDQVDHDDCDGLNNKWLNLKCVTPLQNSRNRRLSILNTSGVTGVVIDKKSGKFKAQIEITENGKRKCIGLGLHIYINDAIIVRKMAEYDHGFHQNHGLNR